MFKRLYSTLKKPHFDVRGVIENIVQHENSIVNRRVNDGELLLKRLKELPQNQNAAKELNKQLHDIQVQRNEIERQLKNGDKNTVSANMKLLKQQHKDVGEKLKKLQSTMQSVCSSLPNLIQKGVPSNEPELVQWINPLKEYRANSAQDHVDIMVKKKMIDLKMGSVVAGNSWYYLMNYGALLEHALISYAISKAMDNDFSFCLPPAVAKNEIIDACGFRPRDMNNEKQIYHLEDSGLGLVATAEIPLAALGINQVLDLSKGPKKIVGLTKSYRAEAGARGKDTKGLYRVHEFSKVELFCWCKPEDSQNILQDLKTFQINLIESLGLSAKVLNMPSNDLGAPAIQKYDIEAWMPGRGQFGELTSTSNCTDFQSRRMGTKYKDEKTGSQTYVHTLNGTALAVPRTILAIVENFYNSETNMITVPEPLIKYMNGLKQI